MSGIQYGLGCGRKLAAFIIYDTCRRHKERKKKFKKAEDEISVKRFYKPLNHIPRETRSDLF